MSCLTETTELVWLFGMRGEAESIDSILNDVTILQPISHKWSHGGRWAGKAVKQAAERSGAASHTSLRAARPFDAVYAQ